MTETAEKVLACIVGCELSIYTVLYGPDRAVVTISNICSLLGLTRYKARKALKELIEDGLIEYTSQGNPAVESYGEYRELVYEAMPPTNGYALTEMGFQDREFRKQYEAWKKSMAEWAEGREE